MIHFECALCIPIYWILNAASYAIHDRKWDTIGFNLVYDLKWLVFFKGFKYVENLENFTILFMFLKAIKSIPFANG